MADSVVIPPLQDIQLDDGGNRSINHHSKMYEMRTYTCHRKDLRGYLKLTEDFFHLRANRSKLLGMWTSELGALNEVIHIWEYDSYEHRNKVRQSFIGDPEWLEKFMSKAAPAWSRQENTTLVPFAWSNMEKPSKTGIHVYEIQTFIMKSQMDLWGDKLHAAMDWSAHCLEPLNSQLIGVFFTIFGQQNSVMALWQHENFDKCAEGKIRLLQEGNRTIMNAFLHEVQSSYSKGLQPHKLSPLQ